MDEKEIKKLLGDLPPLEDHRTKEAIFTRLMEDDRMQATSKKSKRPLKWAPALITVASLLILSLLLPSMLSSDEKVEYALQPASDRTISEEESLDRATHEMESSTLEDAVNDEDIESKLLFREELVDTHPFQVGLVSNDIVVPITFLIPAEQILADFKREEPNAVQLYDKYAAQIQEQALGFDTYHPYEGKLTIDHNVIVHRLPDSHSYGESPEALDVYQTTYQETFIDYPTLQTVDENGEEIQPNDFISYYRYAMPSGKTFLVPMTGKDASRTVEQALIGMKEPKRDYLESLVPQTLMYEIREKNDTVVVEFIESLDLAEMEDGDAMAMIEGFILTATRNHDVIHFENIVQESWGKYDFTSSFSKPIAVNPMEWPYD